MIEEDEWEWQLVENSRSLDQVVTVAISEGFIRVKSPKYMEAKLDIESLKLAVLQRSSISTLIFLRTETFSWKWVCSICRTEQEKLSEGAQFQGFAGTVVDERLQKAKYCFRCQEIIRSFRGHWPDSPSKLAREIHSIAFPYVLRRQVRSAVR